MKKIAILTFIVMAAFYCTPYVSAAEADVAGKTPGVGHVLLRGISNVGLGIMELPQTIVYQNAQIPILGIVTGTICGTFAFAWREIAGLTDLLTFGFSGHGLYFAGMTDFPWNEPWLPPEYSSK